MKVEPADPGAGGDAESVYAPRVSDPYWLLAPLQLLAKGVTLTTEGAKEINGAQRDVLRLSFGQVGLTPTDNSRLYIDPATELVTYWDHMPKGAKGRSGDGENYRKSGGNRRGTEHKMAGGHGGRTVRAAMGW